MGACLPIQASDLSKREVGLLVGHPLTLARLPHQGHVQRLELAGRLPVVLVHISDVLGKPAGDTSGALAQKPQQAPPPASPQRPAAHLPHRRSLSWSGRSWISHSKSKRESRAAGSWRFCSRLRLGL